MSVLFLLVFASIAVAGGFLVAFLWSVRTNQFEDQEGSAMRILHDDPVPNSNVSDNK
ncbi:cbb3-type cytochrome oxidase assembly protein CcoS [Taibaiella soli]|uniref:Cbb3-type cytochrome oxidase assembly protein CcoS n=1 Tax=Taibaiella soli TaxID=1649169 RepID=A0A2W2AGF7_9BACT|nr:cbb3-type cytochrome oxidase assembly protein CcoS [Taibaiella soli]PZF71340.1 cbb3-type cytochrome oxidase assembly protein CcoS [Taibaiella soli]